MYREYEIIFPRYDIFYYDDSDDDTSEYVTLFKDLLAVLNIQIDVEWLRDKFYSYNAGEGDFLVFHNADDAECFISIDCFCDYTDQLDMAMIGIRVTEKNADEAKAAIESLGISWMYGNDCSVREVRDDGLKSKTINYDNFLLECALIDIEKQRARTKKSFESSGIGYHSINSEATIKKDKRIREKKHQPIFHYINGVEVVFKSVSTHSRDCCLFS